MTTRQITMGSILCLVASMSWGAMFPVAELALQQIDPLYFAFLRYLAVTIILVILLWIKEGKYSFRLEGRGKSLLFYGTMGFTVYNMLVFLGQHLAGESGPVAASIMESMMPMIAITLLWITTRKAPPIHTVASILIALAGAMLVITNGKWTFFSTNADNYVPLLLIFGGVVGWVIYSVGGSRYSNWSILRYSTLTCILGTLVSFVVVTTASIFNLVSIPSVQQVLSIKYEMGFMILFPGLIALLSWNAGIKILSPVNGILFINLVPITTFILIYLQGYHISLFEFYGTLLIIFALLRNNLQQRKMIKLRIQN